MNHLQCHCGATFPHIAALMDHRLTDAPHVKVALPRREHVRAVPPQPEPPPRTRETEPGPLPPCTRCGATRHNSALHYARTYRSPEGLCGRCHDRRNGRLALGGPLVATHSQAREVWED